MHGGGEKFLAAVSGRSPVLAGGTQSFASLTPRTRLSEIAAAVLAKEQQSVLRFRPSWRLAPRSATAQTQLDDVGALGAEAGFAIAEIETPQPAKPLVEAEPLDLVPGRLEAARPLGERVGVVLA